MKKLCLLGSTGSIGTQTLDIVRKTSNIQVVSLSTYQNIELLEQQILEFHPRYVAIWDEKKAMEFRKRNPHMPMGIGMEGMLEAVSLSEIDIVITAIVGMIGILPTLEAIKKGKIIGLANKETLVTAGNIVMKAAKEHQVPVLPIDSEHSAIFQALNGEKLTDIQRILITASGGPFRTFTQAELEKVTLEQALKHPNWSMGSKITIDSASMMNKGLEVIEAKRLFGIQPSQIEVVVHPQSIIHSMVEYRDGSTIAQLSMPDMRLPIQYAINYPERHNSVIQPIDWKTIGQMTFESPDFSRFPCLKLAYDALEIDGTMTTVLNAANEVAVAAYLNREIHFLDIPRLIDRAMSNHSVIMEPTLDNILDIEKETRERVKEMI